MGVWKRNTSDSAITYPYICSVCGFGVNPVCGDINLYKFCPYCGAKMDDNTKTEIQKVIYCVDCKFSNHRYPMFDPQLMRVGGNGEFYGFCYKLLHEVQRKDFCSKGERLR